MNTSGALTKMMEDAKSYHKSLRIIMPTSPEVDEPCACCLKRIEKQFAELEKDAALYFTDGKSSVARNIPTK